MAYTNEYRLRFHNGEGGRKFNPGFWEIPPMVRGPPRVVENSTQGFGKVRGHNFGLTIEIPKSKQKS